MHWKALSLAVVGLAAPAVAATRTLELVEAAYELTLGNVAFPGGTAGSLIFSTCTDRGPTTLRVDADTTYATSSGSSPLPEFLETVAAIRSESVQSERMPVTVFYSLTTGRVTRVSVHDGGN